MLQEDRLSQNDPIIEGLLDVKRQLLALEASVQQIRNGNVDVLAPKVEENGLFQDLFHDFFGCS